MLDKTSCPYKASIDRVYLNIKKQKKYTQLKQSIICFRVQQIRITEYNKNIE